LLDCVWERQGTPIQTAGSFVRLGLLSSRTIVREGKPMLKPILSDHERRLLEGTFKTTPDRRLRDRCQAILMADRGRYHHHIAADLAINTRTRQRWRNAYQAQGLDGLTIQWAPGRSPCIPAPLVPEMLTWVKQGPAGCGLDRANWTAAELATSLYQTQGIVVSERTMRAFCTRHGVRPYRPTYHDLKGDPVQQEAARQDLEAFKKKPPPAPSSGSGKMRPVAP
jgi:transposase